MSGTAVGHDVATIERASFISLCDGSSEIQVTPKNVSVILVITAIDIVKSTLCCHIHATGGIASDERWLCATPRARLRSRCDPIDDCSVREDLGPLASN